MSGNAIQDLYPEDYSTCYGCGRLNPHGYRIKSYMEGDVSVCRFTPEPYHTAMPGFVYGGLIASLIDCHATGTAAAAAYRFRNREPGSEPALRFVTASLHVDYLKPTPIGVELELLARVEEIKERKVVISVDLNAGGITCARGRVVAVLMPENMVAKSS